MDRKSEWKTLLGRPRHKWEDNIKKNIYKWILNFRMNLSDSGQSRVLGLCTQANGKFDIKYKGEFFE
jgi:hypothetical protein